MTSENNIEYDNILKLINGICKDMKKENPNLNNNLKGLMNKLDKEMDFIQVDYKKEEKEEKEEKQDEEDNLKNFTKINTEDLFKLPKGVFIRYYTKENDIVKYNSGGFIIFKDPEQKYISFVSNHKKGKPITFNVQINTIHSIYALTENVKAYYLKKTDVDYNLVHGTTKILQKWFSIDNSLMIKMQSGDPNILYMLYDKIDNKLYIPSETQSNTDLLNYLDIKEILFKKTLMEGLTYQLKNPIHNIYIVGLIEKKDVSTLTKMISMIG